MNTTFIADKKFSLKCVRALTLATALTSLQAQAETAPAHFEMTVIADAAYGQHIEAGRADAAISKIDISNTRPSERFFANNNLCVALTKTGELDKAEAVCNKALGIELENSKVPVSEKRAQRDYVAMAYSNRGVLRALAGDLGAARQDFAAALAINTRISAPEQNLAYLNAKESQTLTAR